MISETSETMPELWEVSEKNRSHVECCSPYSRDPRGISLGFVELIMDLVWVFDGPAATRLRTTIIDLVVRGVASFIVPDEDAVTDSSYQPTHLEHFIRLSSVEIVIESLGLSLTEANTVGPRVLRCLHTYATTHCSEMYLCFGTVHPIVSSYNLLHKILYTFK
jgi:hypothetical protein